MWKYIERLITEFDKTRDFILPAYFNLNFRHKMSFVTLRQLIENINIFEIFSTLSNLSSRQHISLHCPKKTPNRFINKFAWFSLPGQASTFTPNDGIVQLCNTSTAVIKRRKWVFVGRTTLLLVSKTLNKPAEHITRVL